MKRRLRGVRMTGKRGFSKIWVSPSELLSDMVGGRVLVTTHNKTNNFRNMLGPRSKRNKHKKVDENEGAHPPSALTKCRSFFRFKSWL